MKRLKTLWLRNQVKPLAAWRAMRELLKNPDDTTQVFHIIEALKGDSLGAAVRRLRSSDRGRALLQKKPDIVSKLNDREWLLSCLLYTSPSPRDVEESRMPSSA